MSLDATALGTTLTTTITTALETAWGDTHAGATAVTGTGTLT